MIRVSSYSGRTGVAWRSGDVKNTPNLYAAFCEDQWSSHISSGIGILLAFLGGRQRDRHEVCCRGHVLAATQVGSLALVLDFFGKSR